MFSSTFHTEISPKYSTDCVSRTHPAECNYPLWSSARPNSIFHFFSFFFFLSSLPFSHK